MKINKFILGECVEILDYKRIPLSSKERENLEKIYPYYGAQGIIDYVDDYIFDGEYILVAEDGNNLKTLQQNIATLVKGKFWVNNHAHILGEKKGVDLKYIYYLINILDLRGYITGSAQPKLSQENFKKIEINLPMYNIQKKIANLLNLIDSKIELNNKINSELEAMVKTIYDYWFLQFEFPNEEGKPYKSSGGKMIWNDELKREIPEGWEVRKLEDIFSFEKGRIPKILYPVYQEGLIPYITIDVVNNNKAQFCDLENMILCKEEVIMVMDGAASGDIYIGNIGAIGSTFSVLRIKRDDISNSLLYCLLNSLKGIYKKVNTGSTVPHANKKYIESMYIPLAKNMEKFSKTFENFYVQIIKNRKENQELASLRDFLLPLLMNGQIGFKK